MTTNKYETILRELCSEVGSDFDDDGIDRVSRYVREAVERRADLARAERIQAIASYISPGCDPRATGVKEQQAKRHPIIPKWWWNGCKAEESDYHSSPEGCTAVIVTSYIGGGETGEETIHLPDAWITAPGDTWKAMIDADAEEKNRALVVAEKEKKRQEALREIERGNAALKKLED